MNGEVLISVVGDIGRIRLNRPKAIHALTLGMCEAMIDALETWRVDPDLRLILLDHAEGRGFCAGGDIRAVAESGRGDGEYARAFFRREYQLNHLMFTYAKTIVAFMDGVTMGGGVGIGLPCRLRVATERTMFAMPETAIGLFPDVGGGWYLSHLPGRVGQFLALTGARLDGAECVALGLATHYIPSDALTEVKARLAADPGDAAAILDTAAEAPPPAAIEAQREAIDRLFASDDYEEIIAALREDGSDWADRQLDVLASKSPQACKIALRLIADAADLIDFADEMRIEYGVATHVCQRHDFLEGVRALLVDKDNAPAWDPPTPEAVTEGLIDRIFAPLGTDEQWMPHRG
jgi:enoyl-CoA hydratase